jgi:hypothetical protein
VGIGEHWIFRKKQCFGCDLSVKSKIVLIKGTLSCPKGGTLICLDKLQIRQALELTLLGVTEETNFLKP